LLKGFGGNVDHGDVALFVEVREVAHWQLRRTLNPEAESSQPN
jgi:hypothetical protein